MKARSVIPYRLFRLTRPIQVIPSPSPTGMRLATIVSWVIATSVATSGWGAPWLSEYATASQAAEKQQKMLLIDFQAPAGNPQADQFENQSLADPEVVRRLEGFVCLRVPVDTRVKTAEGEIRLLDHPSLAEMQGQPGLAIIDYAHRGKPYYGLVVSTFPLGVKHWYSALHVATMLDLPPGTLTQRTMIYAVRIHPERPASTNGQLDGYLLEEAETHASYQAQIRVQGHHAWGTRFQRILGRMPPGLMPKEVCAESWPGDRLVDAAVECVRCWRLSSGHWQGVSGFQPVYAYDMKLGANGVWYATGIFGGSG